MKKTVIGLKMEYLLPTLIASVVCAVCLFLPYATVEGVSISLFGIVTSGGTTMAVAAVAATLAATVLAVLNFVKTSKKLSKITVIVLAVQTALITMLLFHSKTMLDGMGVLPAKFMVKDLSIGYWGALIASYVTLVLAMKLTKTNTGYIVLTILGVIWLFPSCGSC